MTLASIQHRLKVVQASLAAHQAMMIANPNHISYLTHFQFLVPEEREALLIVTQQKSFLLHNSFSPLPTFMAEVSNLISLPHCHPASLVNHLNTILDQQRSINELLVDEEALFVQEYKQLTNFPNLKLSPLDHQPLWQLRMVKTDPEIVAARQAAAIANQAWQELSANLKPGMTEIDIKQNLDYIMGKLGSQRPAFPTIVAIGDHSALPHHQPGDTPLQIKTPILVDWGATVSGYRSDMTRTIWFGPQISQEFKLIEDVVLQAYQTTLNKLQTAIAQQQPISALDLDRAARVVINEAGYGTFFIHTTGHGVGLDIHEQPSLNWRNETTIKPGMIITIEPGIYLENKFGYRYENTVLVTETGAQELTNL